MANTSLYLFRNDLRLNDNLALSAACHSGQAVILLFIFDDTDPRWPIGRASQWWLHHSLQSLGADIKKLGGKLILRKGETLSILKEIIKQAEVNKLYFSRAYEPHQKKIEEKTSCVCSPVAEWLLRAVLDVRRLPVVVAAFSSSTWCCLRLNSKLDLISQPAMQHCKHNVIS